MIERLGMRKEFAVAADEAAVQPQFLRIGEWIDGLRFDGERVGGAGRYGNLSAHPEKAIRLMRGRGELPIFGLPAMRRRRSGNLATRIWTMMALMLALLLVAWAVGLF